MVINTILGAVGLELRRKGGPHRLHAASGKQDTAGAIVELIGAQGIGKTTLNNALYKALKTTWFFRADLGQIGPADAPAADIEQLHREIFFQRITSLKRDQKDPWKSITVARQMSHVISESMTLLTKDYDCGFFLDEGLCKNFPQEVLALGSKERWPLWQNRAFVYMRARDPDLVVKRYQKRDAERSRRGLPQRATSDTDIRARIERDTQIFDQILDTGQRFGCPTLIVHPEDTHQDNVNKVLDFERTLRTNLRHK